MCSERNRIRITIDGKKAIMRRDEMKQSFGVAGTTKGAVEKNTPRGL